MKYIATANFVSNALGHIEKGQKFEASEEFGDHLCDEAKVAQRIDDSGRKNKMDNSRKTKPETEEIKKKSSGITTASVSGSLSQADRATEKKTAKKSGKRAIKR